MKTSIFTPPIADNAFFLAVTVASAWPSAAPASAPAPSDLDLVSAAASAAAAAAAAAAGCLLVAVMPATRRVSPGVPGPFLIGLLGVAPVAVLDAFSFADAFGRRGDLLFLLAPPLDDESFVADVVVVVVSFNAFGGFTDALGGNADATDVSVSGFVARGGRVGVFNFAVRARDAAVVLGVDTPFFGVPGVLLLLPGLVLQQQLVGVARRMRVTFDPVPSRTATTERDQVWGGRREEGTGMLVSI